MMKKSDKKDKNLGKYQTLSHKIGRIQNVDKIFEDQNAFIKDFVNSVALLIF